jgi:hypothetical protein
MLRSWRRRRQLLWLTVAAGVGAGTAALVLELPQRAAPEQAPVVAGKPDRPPAQPKTVAMTAARQAAVDRVAAEFVADAVLRQHVDRSWALVSPTLRQGMTRSQWASGEIPVVPFPAREVAAVRSRVVFSYAARVGLDVLVIPRRRSAYRQTVFRLDLSPASRPSRGWLVDGWTPVGTVDAPAPLRSEAVEPGGTSTLGTVWLAIPGALFGLILLLPLAYWTREWHRNRRSRRSADPASRALPPLPALAARSWPANADREQR